MSRLFPSIALFIGILGLSQPVQASCGLDQCPLESAGSGPEQWMASASTRFTSVAAGKWYAEQFFGLGRKVLKSYRLQLSLPLVHNPQGGAVQTGLGNGVALVEWGAVARAPLVALGLQVELPTANDPALGDGHFLLLPYGRFGTRWTSWYFESQLGWAVALTGGHHHHDHDHGHGAATTPVTVPVNPHSNSELLGRGAVGYRHQQGDSEYRLGLGLDGIHELVEGRETLVHAQAQLQWRTPRVHVDLQAAAPVTESRRWIHRFQLTLGLPF